MILTIERKEIPTILVNKKWIQRKKDTISAEYDERKVFSYLKKRRRRKKKILKVTRPLSLLPPKNPHTQKKIKARPPRCISGFIMGNNQKCRSKTVEHILFFPVLIWITKKKRLYFTIHKFGWDYSRILHSSSLQSLQDHNGGHGWKNRTNGEARLYKLLTKIRKSSTSLQFRLGWKTLEKKNRQNILQQQPQKQITEWAASLHQQPCEKAASKAQKTINRKKKLFTLPKN